MKNRAVLLTAITLFAAGFVQGEIIQGVDIPFVSIGYAGNDVDLNGFGAVSYNYRISKYEISYNNFSASELGSGNEDEWLYLGGSAPVAKVTWADAAQYCNWLTSGDTNSGAYTVSGGLVTGIDRSAAISTYGTVYVMPTEDEWYKAAYYKGSSDSYQLYASTLGTQPSTNDARYGGLSTPWLVEDGAEELNGTFNMMGNILEHTETLDEGDVVYRGGGYFQTATELQSSWSTTDITTGEYATVGIRVVAIPEPGTISFMSLSAMGLFLTRSIRRRRIALSVLPVRRQSLCDFYGDQQMWEMASWADKKSVEIDFVSNGFTVFNEFICENLKALHASCEHFERKFWDKMVQRHDRKLQRRTQLRKAIKQKTLNWLDRVLSVIMK